MKILYFTSTGNCLYVAKRIGGELLSIPRLQKDGVYDIQDDTVGIVVPIYSFDVPRNVRRYFDKVNIKAEYVFAVMTYGNLSMAALRQLKKLLESRNVPLHYSAEIKMVDNYLPIFEAVEQIKKQDDAKTEQEIDAIIAGIKNRECSLVQHGLFKRYMTYIYSRRYAAGKDNHNPHTSAQLFTVNDNCNGCGTCREVCPVKNITGMTKPEYQDHCEFCLACIHLCPKNAIHLPMEKSEKRFINPHIKLPEIIRANNQV
jgi:ferredoxin